MLYNKRIRVNDFYHNVIQPSAIWNIGTKYVQFLSQNKKKCFRRTTEQCLCKWWAILCRIHLIYSTHSTIVWCMYIRVIHGISTVVLLCGGLFLTPWSWHLESYPYCNSENGRIYPRREAVATKKRTWPQKRDMYEALANDSEESSPKIGSYFGYQKQTCASFCVRYGKKDKHIRTLRARLLCKKTLYYKE